MYPGYLCIVPASLFLCLAAFIPAHSQSNRVVNIGNTTVDQVLNGLGFNLDPDQEWQWIAAAEAGATHARFQCSWAAVEQQTPPPSNSAGNPQYIQDQHCSKGLALARKYNIRPTIVAAFGPPYHKILTVTLPHDLQQGVRQIEVHRESGIAGETFGNLRSLYDYICPTTVDDSGQSNQECAGQFTARHSYQGSLIVEGRSRNGGTDATLNLASGLSQPVPASSTTLTGCHMDANATLLICSNTGKGVAQSRGAQVIVAGAGKGGADLVTALVASGPFGVITLAHASSQSVRESTAKITTMYLVHEILYPSASSDSPTDPSVIAYSNYVSFLAKDMASQGVSGDIEIWNEPPWSNDPWDYRPGLFDPGSYSGSPEFGANYGFAANIMRRTLPPGVTVTWNGTSGSSSGSLLGPGMKQFTGEDLFQPSSVITRESFHPYGGNFGNPEEAMFVQACLEGTAAASPSSPAANPFANGADCYLPGEAKTANFMLSVRLDLNARRKDPSYGVGHSITETNVLPPVAGMLQQQARAVLRHFIGYEGDGITPIEFFKLYQGGVADPSYGFVQKGQENGVPSTTPAYESLHYFMDSIKALGKTLPSRYESAEVPGVLAYKGQYPLASVHLMGARANAIANSDAVILWQLSSCTTGHACWFYLPSPEAAQVKLEIPQKMKVTSVVNLICRCPVKHIISGGVLQLDVADDPVEVIVDPTSE